MWRVFRIVGVSAALVGAASGQAVAQSNGRFYVGAGVGTFRVSADAVGGLSAAQSVVAGIGVTPWLDLEVDLALPTRSFSRTYGGDALSLSFAPAGASREEIERFGIWLRYDNRREVIASVSSVAIFHASSGRVRPGLVVGVTNQRVRDRTDYTPVRLGPAVDLTNPHASPRVETSSHTKGALTIGDRRAASYLDRAGSSIRLRIDRRRDQQRAALVGSCVVSVLSQRHALRSLVIRMSAFWSGLKPDTTIVHWSG
jgi:hypothetical protein